MKTGPVQMLLIEGAITFREAEIIGVSMQIPREMNREYRFFCVARRPNGELLPLVTADGSSFEVPIAVNYNGTTVDADVFAATYEDDYGAVDLPEIVPANMCKVCRRRNSCAAANNKNTPAWCTAYADEED